MVRTIDYRKRNIDDRQLAELLPKELAGEKQLYDFSENLISCEGLKRVIEALLHDKSLLARLWLNKFSFTDMYSLLLDMNALHLVTTGRLSAENTEAARALEKQAVRGLSADGSIKKLIDHIDRYIGTDAMTVEQEVRTAVTEALEEGYLLPLHTLWSDDGRLAELEFDGIVAGKYNGQELLVLVEAKHRVKETHITSKDSTKPGLVERMKKFEEMVARADRVQPAELKVHKVGDQYAMLRNYKDCRVVGAIGGPNFADSIQAFAKKKGLITVSTSGMRYVVTHP